MIKTILAGAVLSTGLFTGGMSGIEHMQSDQKVEKSKYSETIQKPAGSNTQDVKVLPTQEGNEIPEGAVLAQPVEGNTSTQDVNVLPTQEGNEIPEGAVLAQPVEGNTSTQDVNVLPAQEGNEIPEGAVLAQPVEGNTSN
ncbi:TPA: hypothetical protein QFT23_005952 [Bacillus cereus]|nr:hypothetical protein [Bacillus cereus]